ncbi:10642_t:CDS:10, partial [Scutellospora calospora]
VRPRQFLETDTENRIKTIFTERQGYLLHEFINRDDPFRLFIDFDLPQETLNNIKPKFIYKQVYYALIRAFRVASFIDLVSKKLLVVKIKYEKTSKKTDKHIHPKIAMMPKDSTIFDFMLRSPNDEAPVVDSLLLSVPELVTTRIYNSYNKATETTKAEFKLIESLLKEKSIEGYSLLYSLEKYPNTFLLTHIISSHCLLCDREYTSDNKKEPDVRKSLIKLTIDKSAEKQEKRFPEPVKLKKPRISDPNDHFLLKIEDFDNSLFYDMASKLDIAEYEIKVTEYQRESIGLRTFINQAVVKEFKAQLAKEINPAIIDPILWHAKNIISGKSEELSKQIQVLNFSIQPLILKNIEKHKYNDHLKSLITEDYLTIEYKGLKPKVLKDYSRFMVLSNHNVLLQIEIGDRHVVYFDVSSCCKGNTTYFKNLAKVLEYPNAPSMVMAYLLTLDLSDWNPQNIPSTKIKPEDQVNKPSSNIEEFSDSSQSEILVNTSTDIPVFDVSKIVIPQPEKNIAKSSTTDHIKKVASSSESANISITPEIIYVEAVDNKSEIIESVNEEVNSSSNILVDDELEISSDLAVNNKLSPKSNLDKFITITNKNRTDSIDYLTRIDVDTNTCLFNIEQGNDSYDFIEMMHRERLIGEEILCYRLEDAGRPIWLDTNEE